MNFNLIPKVGFHFLLNKTPLCFPGWNEQSPQSAVWRQRAGTMGKGAQLRDPCPLTSLGVLFPSHTGKPRAKGACSEDLQNFCSWSNRREESSRQLLLPFAGGNFPQTASTSTLHAMTRQQWNISQQILKDDFAVAFLKLPIQTEDSYVRKILDQPFQARLEQK